MEAGPQGDGSRAAGGREPTRREGDGSLARGQDPGCRGDGSRAGGWAGAGPQGRGDESRAARGGAGPGPQGRQVIILPQLIKHRILNDLNEKLQVHTGGRVLYTELIVVMDAR